MKHIRKTLSILLAAISLVIFVTGCGDSKEKESPSPTSSSQQGKTPVSRIGEETLQYPGNNEKYEYDVYETYVEIKKYVGNEVDVTVPSTIDDLPVKVVGGFYVNNSTIEKITLPKEIVKITRCAFDGCENLKSINIPEGVTEIGDRAFFDCFSLSSLEIPKSVIKIGEFAFGIGRKNGDFKDIDTLVVKFYKGSAAAKYIANNSGIKYEIIDE